MAQRQALRLRKGCNKNGRNRSMPSAFYAPFVPQSIYAKHMRKTHALQFRKKEHCLVREPWSQNCKDNPISQNSRNTYPDHLPRKGLFKAESLMSLVCFLALCFPFSSVCLFLFNIIGFCSPVFLCWFRAAISSLQTFYHGLCLSRSLSVCGLPPRRISDERRKA